MTDPIILERVFPDTPWFDVSGKLYRENPFVTEEEWAAIELERETWFREVYDVRFPQGASFMAASWAFEGEVPPHAVDVMESRYRDHEKAADAVALRAMPLEERLLFL